MSLPQSTLVTAALLALVLNAASIGDAVAGSGAAMSPSSAGSPTARTR
jgi:hypothetical protein